MAYILLKHTDWELKVVCKKLAERLNSSCSNLSLPDASKDSQEQATGGSRELPTGDTRTQATGDSQGQSDNGFQKQPAVFQRLPWGNQTTKYECSEVVEFLVSPDEKKESEVTLTGEHPFFFDNTPYIFHLKLKNGAKSPRLRLDLKSLEESFQTEDNFLYGTLDFGNSIGHFDLSFEYTKDDTTKGVRFSFEVLSTKLDYHKHWNILIQDIENERAMLAFDFLRETYHLFGSDSKPPEEATPEMLWWWIYKVYHEQFISASRLILARPRHRTRPSGEYLRADRLKFLTPRLEEELKEHYQDPTHLYYTEKIEDSRDTQENRFFKMAVNAVAKKYREISEKLQGIDKLTESATKENDRLKNDLEAIERNPFFRGVGKFQGLRQESLILQRAPGYSSVFRIFSILQMLYSLEGNGLRYETKDIATLYEIWCFIKVKNILKELTQAEADIKAIESKEAFGTLGLCRGEESKVIFRSNGLEVAELLYNPQVTDKSDNKDTGILGTVAPTAQIAGGLNSGERPDIVLRVTKEFQGDKNYKLTYLFDAKYRIEGTYSKNKPYSGVSYPPQDAFDQMHRYRDAIYFKDGQNDESLKREVVGGYILFPGQGDNEKIGKAPFIDTIRQVNIGAFPITPGNKNVEELLKQFLEGIVKDNKWQDDLMTLPPQKGLSYFPSAKLSQTDAILQVPKGMGILLESGEDTYFAVSKGYARDPQKVYVILTEENNAPVNDTEHSTAEQMSLHPVPHSHRLLKSYRVSEITNGSALENLSAEEQGKLDSNIEYDIWKIEGTMN